MLDIAGPYNAELFWYLTVGDRVIFLASPFQYIAPPPLAAELPIKDVFLIFTLASEKYNAPPSEFNALLPWNSELLIVLFFVDLMSKAPPDNSANVYY